MQVSGIMFSCRVPGCECDGDSRFWLHVHFSGAVWFQWLWVQPPCGCHSHPMGYHTQWHWELILQRKDQDRLEKVGQICLSKLSLETICPYTIYSHRKKRTCFLGRSANQTVNHFIEPSHTVFSPLILSHAGSLILRPFSEYLKA